MEAQRAVEAVHALSALEIYLSGEAGLLRSFLAGKIMEMSSDQPASATGWSSDKSYLINGFRAKAQELARRLAKV